jgi:hypothetical protein
MDSVVDPSADYIWKSVRTIVDAKGIHDYQPRTEADWHEVRRRAILLAEVANLLDVPGRRVAHGDRTYEDHQQLNVAEIQKRIDSNHAALVGFAAALRDTGLKLVAAADKKDVGAITQLGSTLDSVCEACHLVFWYPEDKDYPRQ